MDGGAIARMIWQASAAVPFNYINLDGIVKTRERLRERSSGQSGLVVDPFAVYTSDDRMMVARVARGASHLHNGLYINKIYTLPRVDPLYASYRYETIVYTANAAMPFHF